MDALNATPPMTARDFRIKRILLNMNQPQLAARLGVSMRQLSRYENGHSTIPTAIALALQTLESRGPLPDPSHMRARSQGGSP